MSDKIISADEAREALAAYEADDENDGPMVALAEDSLRTVIALTASRDDAADAFDRLVARVWRAATGDTHEGPASVEVLLAAVERLRADLADTRAALRANLRCDECDELATRCHADTARFGCEAHGVGEGWADTTHAAVVREALR